jgi:hypothetical protein
MCSLLSDLWAAIVTGIIPGIASVLVYEAGKYLWDSVRFARRYNRYVGKYDAFFKIYSSDEYIEMKPTKQICLTRKRNKFIIHGKSPVDVNPFEGEITMMGDYGKGYYHHTHEGDDKKARFGFMEIQLDDPYILVHETIYDRKKIQPDSERTIGVVHPDGYRWIRSGR